MGKTLFWYLFKDLVRIFLLSAIVIAGIMSFGGLLRPLTQKGLDAIQVAQMWLYLMPAMMTYSLPVAAVFATSMVYGRLAADNELTACRAAGIGYRSICAPAISLGLVSALCSLMFLGYIVPFFSYQVERVIYANVAKVIASEIQRTHAYSPGGGKPGIFAQQAYIPPESGKDGEQIVVLRQPTIMSYRKDPLRPKLEIPSVFSLANEATLYIRQGESNEVEISGVLLKATSFARTLGGRPEFGIERLEFGPISYPSPLRQNVKFMDVTRLKDLAAAPEKSNRVKRSMKGYIEQEQRDIIHRKMAEALVLTPEQGYIIDSGEQYQILAPGASMAPVGRDVVVTPAPGKRIQVLLKRTGGRPVRSFDAGELRVNVEMDNEYQMVIYTLKMVDARIRTGDEIVETPESQPQVCTTAMPPELQAIQKRTAAEYLSPKSPLGGEKRDLLRAKIVSLNEVMAEMHSRASFAVSCLVLVIVGSVLGMQFRSGDFLSAFAVSFIPALLTITLVVSGMQTAGQVSEKTLSNPIVTAITLIWLGNVLAAILAGILFWRIRRT